MRFHKLVFKYGILEKFQKSPKEVPKKFQRSPKEVPKKVQRSSKEVSKTATTSSSKSTQYELHPSLLEGVKDFVSMSLLRLLSLHHPFINGLKPELGFWLIKDD